MSSAPDVFVVDIFTDVCQKASVETGFNINYVYGTNIDVLKNLKYKDESVSKKNAKYPLVALYMPIKEKKNDGYYSSIFIRKIVIAQLTNKDYLPEERYTEVMKTTLYPVYNSIIKYLARNINVVGATIQNLKHDKYDFFQSEPVSGINDFVDTVQLNNLEFKINQLKNCK